MASVSGSLEGVWGAREENVQSRPQTRYGSLPHCLLTLEPLLATVDDAVRCC